LIESPGPNTNKPLHIGHLRNILLGASLFNMYKFTGKKPHLVNVVNDRGVHICKSMLAYKKWGQGRTPEQAGKKPDHFVGDWYVRYTVEAEKNPELENEVQDMLLKWEQGDEETVRLWKKMNGWALQGFSDTYAKLGFKIEKDYMESDTYKHGKEIVLDGLNKGLFFKDEEGAVCVDLEKQGLGKKVLIRANGTSVYITQDIYLAKKRFDDYKFSEMVYVVGNEQQHHFKVLFQIFRILGYEFGNHCKHFSYGLVELPEGKMKSREGKVVDTDDLIDAVITLAKEEVKKRHPDIDDKEADKRAVQIGFSAVRFFFLKYDSLKNFVFNPEESLSFEGETGPYVQYAHARICSILRKAGITEDRSSITAENIDYGLLDSNDDKNLAKRMLEFPAVVEKAAGELKPNLVCNYLLKLAQEFSQYYNSSKIIQGESDKRLQDARIALAVCVKQVIKNGLALLEIESPEEM
ncbi:arginine--tRNA ligase, partial [Candidatus Woesearchaeota archaeon]|nr:arginine--tRNA ligase [Candidatus Woesearchaeota archaeon]